MAISHKFLTLFALVATVSLVNAEDNNNNNDKIDFNAQMTVLRKKFDACVVTAQQKAEELHLKEKIALLPEKTEKFFNDYPMDLVSAFFVGAGMSGYRKASAFYNDAKFEQLKAMTQRESVSFFKKSAKRSMFIGGALGIGHFLSHYKVSPVQQDNTVAVKVENPTVNS